MTLEKIKKLLKAYKGGLIPTLAEHEVHPEQPLSSRERYLYFTLPPCLNFQRSSPAMWRAALASWDDEATRYLFFPEKVIAVSRDKVQEDLTRYGLALQKNRHTDIWLAISKTLARDYESDPRMLLNSNNCDTIRILDTLQNLKKKDFPYLSGPKMANYWLYILSRYTDVVFKNREYISIIPDTHVMQCTQHLGLIEGISTPEKVALIWRELLAGSEITPVEMHPVLWNWSRNDFKPNV